MEQVRTRYSAVAIILHWAIAALVVANVWMGWQFEELSRAERTALMQVHKAVGISILMLTLLRIAWRLVNKPPPLSETMNRLERVGARIVHTGFYVLLIALPLTGWITISGHDNPQPIDMFGLFEIPALGPVVNLDHDLRHDVHDITEEAHHLLAQIVVYGLVPLHILGALKHQFIDREDELGRMLPFPTRRARG